MMIRSTCCTLALLLAVGVVPVRAEDTDDHSRHDTATVTLDGNDVRPSTLTMKQSDVLAFVNYSTHPVTVTFTEPADIQQKVRCGLLKTQEHKASTSAAPWALFTWQNGKLTGTLPPGRFASVCSLDPGHYAFTATMFAHGARSSDSEGILPVKGQVEVK